MEKDTAQHETPSVPPMTEEKEPGPFQHDKLSAFVLRFLNRLKRTGKSSHTISAYRNDLSFFSAFLIENKLDPQNFAFDMRTAWVQYLKTHGRHSDASQRRAMMCVRTFLHYLIKEKIIANSPLLEVKSPRQPKHALLTIQHAQYKTLVKTLEKAAAEGDEKAARDLVIIMILGECGLKASEAAGLTWADLFLEPSTSESPEGSLRIPGLNERILKFGTSLQRGLVHLKNVRASLNLPIGPKGKLFFGYTNISRRTRTPSLHRHGIKFVVYEVCEEILGVPYNSESLRNHAIVRWLDKGLSIQQVADLAGYSSLHSLERFETDARRKPKRQHKS
jgi:site-specific recombinase XerD